VLLSAPPKILRNLSPLRAWVSDPRYREVAPSPFTLTGRSHLEAGSTYDRLRRAGEMLLAGADCHAGERLSFCGMMCSIEYSAVDTSFFLPGFSILRCAQSSKTWCISSGSSATSTRQYLSYLLVFIEP